MFVFNQRLAGLAPVTALCATLATSAFAGDEATAPASGTYAGLIYVQKAGSGCLDVSGNTLFGEASFNGLSSTSLIIRMPISGSGLAVISQQTLTVTSGKGTTHPSGTLAWTGNGVGNSWSVSGTFSATITEVGAHTFVMQIKETYASCAEEDTNISLVRMGAFQ